MQSSKCEVDKHQYMDTGEKELCPTCVGKVEQKVRICSLCGDRIVGASEFEKWKIQQKKKERKLREKAAKAKAAQESASTLRIRHVVDDIVDPIQDPHVLLPRDEHWTPVHHWSWNKRHALKKVYLAALKQMATITIPKPEFSEDFGVVVVGGDSKYGEYGLQAAVCFRMLYGVCGYKGFAEWHYRSDRESIEPELIHDINIDGRIRIRDLNNTPHDNWNPCGWSDKSKSMLHPDPERPFRYALRLDADAYPTADIMPLFEQVKSIPILFWSEGSKIQWDRVWPNGPNGVPGIQGGQIFVDRKEAYDWLVVSNYLDNHREFYYPDKHNSLVDWWNYGDQGAAEIALTALRDSGKHILFKVLGIPRFLQNVHEYTHHGKTVFVHRVRDKMTKNGFVPKPGVYMEKEAHACLETCMYLKRNSFEVFDAIYKKKAWQASSKGSLSGPGSEIEVSKPWIDYVNQSIAKFQDPFVLDLGCGDGNLTTRYNVKKYMGLDVSLPRTWPDPGIFRRRFDFWKDREKIPYEAEIWLMKDVLQHWPNKMVSDWLAWARDFGKFKRLIVCHDIEPEVHDILLGECRGLPMTAAPMQEIPWQLIQVFDVPGRPRKAILVFDKGEVP